MVDSNINEIIDIDPQVQLPGCIQLEGMGQVRPNGIFKLHVMDIAYFVTGLL